MTALQVTTKTHAQNDVIIQNHLRSKEGEKFLPIHMFFMDLGNEAEFPQKHIKPTINQYQTSSDLHNTKIVYIHGLLEQIDVGKPIAAQLHSIYNELIQHSTANNYSELAFIVDVETLELAKQYALMPREDLLAAGLTSKLMRQVNYTHYIY